MLKKFLREVVVILVGKNAEGVVDLLINEKYVNEFLIAKKMNLTINQTRNILYKLSDYGLVSSTRKKDKKKGWYTYSWRIEIIKSLEFLKKEYLKKIAVLNDLVRSRETKQFYTCERCKIEISEENALLHNFTCNECGDLFVVKDAEKFLKELRRNLTKLQNEIEIIDKEIETHQAKLDKVKLREQMKKEKIKSAERKRKAEERKKLKAKESGKKTLKKKSVKKASKKTTKKKSARKK